MMPVNSVQSTFVGGEISPAILGRTDLERFSTSATTLENFQPAVEGPITRRVGTQVRTVAGSVEVSDGRLVAFSSGDFNAALLFRNLSIRVIPGNPADVAEEVNIVSPYLLAEVEEVQVCQVNDVLFLTHPLHPPARLARYGVGNWAYEVLPLEAGPYLDYRAEDAGVSLKISNVVDRIRLTSTYADEFISSVGFGADSHVEYNSTNARALGIVRTKFSDADVDIEPLEERCFSLDKEIHALGLFTGYGAGGTEPYNISTAANYTELWLDNGSPFPTTTRMVKGCYYQIASVGTTNFVTYGAATNTAGTYFYANQSLSAIAGSGTLYNMNVGFSHQFVITNDILNNYLRFIDEDGLARWMEVKSRRGVPQQSSYGLIAQGPFILIQANGTFVVPKPYTGTITQGPRRITATITASSGVFTASDVGRWLRLEFGQVVVDAKITALTNASTVQVSLLRGVPLSGESNNLRMDSTTTVWRRGSFYPGNYPRCVSFFEQRLCFAATPAEPQTIWMSKTADYYTFAPTNQNSIVEDDSSINVTLATDVFQDIRWMTNRSVLVVGTSNAEWAITAGQNREALTPKTVTARRESSYGSSLIQALQSGRSTVFVQNGSIRVRELTYDYSVDSHVPIDVTVFASHLFPGHEGVAELHYVRQPDPMLLAVTGSGQLAAMVYEPDQKVYAWTRFVLGGPGSPKIVSACVTQSAVADTTWVLVLRGGRYTVEQFFPVYRPTSVEDVSTIHYFLDSAASFAVIGPPTVNYTLTGHERFRDSTVAVLIDDQLYSEVPVVGLNIVLPKEPLTRLWVGFASVARFVSFPVVPASKSGPAPGRTISVSKITLRVRNTLDFHYGVEGVDLQEHKVRTTADPVTRTPYLRNEDIVLSMPRKFDTLIRWVVESRRPYPISIQMASVDMAQTT